MKSVVAVPGIAPPGIAQPGIAQPGIALPGIALPGIALLGIALLAAPRPGWADPAENLCARNPAFAPDYMERVVRAELQGDHDPSLENDTPEHVAQQAATQGIKECAADLQRDPSIATAFAGLSPADEEAAWDAYNTACADRRTSRGACITAEVKSGDALKHMINKNDPAGAKALIQTCELVMVNDPPMAEWRECVDQALAVHASESAAQHCKLSATWHVAKTGADAGAKVAACLRAQ